MATKSISAGLKTYINIRDHPIDANNQDEVVAAKKEDDEDEEVFSGGHATTRDLLRLEGKKQP